MNSKCGWCDGQARKDSKYCSDECKALSKAQLRKEAANDKYGEGWDDDRPCASEGCDKLITMEGRDGIAPSAYIRIQYHSASCAQKSIAKIKKLGIKNLDGLNKDIKKSMFNLREKSAKAAAEERAERIAFTRSPANFTNLPPEEMIVFKALKAK